MEAGREASERVTSLKHNNRRPLLSCGEGRGKPAQASPDYGYISSDGAHRASGTTTSWRRA